jgi:small-conductance mechanosensitive channel
MLPYRWRTLCSALLACVAVQLACAQAASAPADAASAPRAAGVPLVVFNRTIIVFRQTAAGFGAADRAQLAEERIRSLLRRGGPGVVTNEANAQGTVVSIDGALAFIVTRGEADTLAGETPEAVARRSSDTLRQVIGETRELRDPRAMGTAVTLAIAGTLLFVALLWMLDRASRSLGARILRGAATRTRRLHLGGVELLESDRALVLLRHVLRGLFWIVALLIANAWVSFVLQLFPYTRAWGERLDDFLLDTGAAMLGAVARAVPGLLVAVAIVLIARFAAAVVSGFFDRLQRGRIALGWLDADTVRPTRKLAVLAVWLLAAAMAYPYLPGAETEAFKGLSVLVGLMVSIGGASIVGQALSGFILMYNRTFRIGDYVRIGDHQGTVVDIGIYQTRVRTGTGEELTLPNSLVLGTVTQNYSRAVEGGGFMIEATVTIGYDTPWRQVHAMLLEAASRTPGLAAQPEPHVFQLALSDFYVEYRLVAYATLADARPRAEAMNVLHQHIQDVFNEHGVQIMSPHYLDDPQAPKVVPRSRWFAPPADREAGREAGSGGCPQP